MPWLPKAHKPRLQTLGFRVKEHKPKPRNRQADRALHTGSAAWRRLRLTILARDLYICAACGTLGDQSMHVDHRDGDDSNNDPSNLQAMHGACHAEKTSREDGGFGNEPKARPAFDAHGNPVGDAGKHWR